MTPATTDMREIIRRVERGELDTATAAVLLGAPRTPVAAPTRPPAPASTIPVAGAPDPVRTAPVASAPDPVTVAPASQEPIAVVGVSARLPGADDADAFWAALLAGRDLVTEVPRQRWAVERFYDPDASAAGRTVSKWGAFVEDAMAFDADFFGLTPREAELTDPQARLFLQEAWRALENAGHDPRAMAGRRCGVYAGVMMNDYPTRVARHSPHAMLPQVMQGNSTSMLAARVAYELDLRGPTAGIDSACSSSLLALHLASQALWLGEADLMIVGGVTLYCTELPYIYMSGAGMLSPTGRERPFDQAADGIVPGEGCVVVVLEPLARALANGDPVQAVIRASGANADGRTNGITAPSRHAQATLVRDTYRRFGIDPTSIDYVECHGTGTSLGDPIEVGALNDVFAPAGLPRGSVPIGSVKANVGHTSAAAGLTSLVKAIGVVRTGLVPPTLHLERGNPLVPLAEGPFTVAAEARPLRAGPRPRRVAVSAFGLGGTNTHVVVEQAPPRQPRATPGGAVVVPVSARRPELLRRAVEELRRWLEGPGAEAVPADIAHTLGVARSHHRHRAVFVAADRAQLLAVLAGDPGLPPPRELRAVAEAYLRGEDVDWAAVYPPDAHRRLAMPGYPFARDRHDVASPVEPGPVAEEPGLFAAMPEALDGGVEAPDGPEGDLDTIRPVWRQATWAAPAALADAIHGDLVVHDTVGDLAAALRGTGPHRSATATDGDGDGDGEGAPADTTVVVRFDSVGSVETAEAFEAVRRTMTSGPRGRKLTVLAVTADPTLIMGAGAFVRTLQGENPRVRGRAVLVDDVATAAPVVLSELVAPMAPATATVDRRAGRRSVLAWEPYLAAGSGTSPLRRGGVYLVTGGMGGIGRTIARHLADRHGARVVLCGRRPLAALDEAVRPAHDDSAIRYVQLDVADQARVAAVVRDVLAGEGRLDGVLHAAGITRDAFLVRKRPGDVAAVLAAKLEGVRALDAATADLPLDMFVLFSSVAAVTGNLGQSDYAFGNGHLDGFALHRSRLVRRGERSGRTLSVDWPLWDGGGMTVPDPVRSVLREQVGMVPLPLSRGIAAFERLLATPETDTSAVTCVFHGDVAVWRRHLAAHGVLTPPAAPVVEMLPAPVVETLPAPVVEPLLAAVIGRVAEVLGRSAADLSAATRIEALGLDSLMIRNLVAELSRSIAPIGPEALYGARDLGGLAALLTRGSAVAPADPAGAAPVDPGTIRAATQSQRDTPAAPPCSGAGAFRHRPQPSGGADAAPDAIAIVGLAGRYPDAPDLATFWQNLVNGRDTVADPPAGRWADDAGVTARAHFLDGVDRFDPEFFGVSEFDAALSDPQERLMLEVAWQALEDAGYAGRRLDALRASDGQPRAVGVFAGVTSADYQLLGAEQWAKGGRTIPGGHAWSVANRVSYLFDLHGPSQPVDTACSSSLVALHLASESIRRGECAAAIVGGVNLYLHPSRFLMLRRSGFLAEDGRCRGFGTGGAGFGPGEGAGAVLLRPLADAVAAGDQIYGVLRGSAVAHGGRTNGYTAPSPVAQARVIRQALVAAAVDPATVTVVEAHGTGTELGDPVEVAGLAASYGPSDAPACSLGTVKSMIGHGESVAGMAALTKVLLQIRHATLVPTLHADPVNPALHLGSTRFRLQHQAEAWPPLLDDAGTPLPRRAGISSFGAGGVNAHVIVEEYQGGLPADDGSARDEPQLILLSGPTPDHVRTTAGRLADWIRMAPAATAPGGLARIAHTLREGRAVGPCRLAVVAAGAGGLAEALTGDARRIGDLRGARAEHPLAGLSETGELLARLWQGERLEVLGRLWLDGLDVVAGRPATGVCERIVEVPPSAMLRRPLWFTEQDGLAAAPAPAPSVPPVPPAPPTTTDPRAPAPATAENPAVGTGVAEPEDGTDDPDGVAARVATLAALKATGTAAMIDLDRTLPEWGVDSINLTNLRFEIAQVFGVSIPLGELAERPFREISERIVAHAGTAKRGNAHANGR